MPRKKILITDDLELNRIILTDILSEDYDILEASDGQEALKVLESNIVDLMLLDAIMPVMDGFETLRKMKIYGLNENVPVIMISADTDVLTIDQAYELGVTDFISRPFDSLVVKRRVSNTLALYEKQKKLMRLVANQIFEREKNNKLMITMLSHIVEFRNQESGLHVLHIQAITRLLAAKLIEKTKKYNLTKEDINLISTASALHDIGKISIPESILNKPGKLTSDEFEIMKGHSAAGAAMISALPMYQDFPLVKFCYDICLFHHERWDGRGYPYGREGDDIPISAQIVSLADVYDALISPRVYKPAYSHDEAIHMILNGECGLFNPLLLECLKEVEGEIPFNLSQEAIFQINQNEVRDIVVDLLERDQLIATERDMEDLEKEKTKYEFIMDLSTDIQMEYTYDPAILRLNEKGAKDIGLSTSLFENPFSNEELCQIFDAQRVSDLLTELSTNEKYKNENLETEMYLNVHGEKRLYRFFGRSLWTGSHFRGALGKLVDIHENEEKILKLENQAHHDSLTGLLNLASAQKKIEDKLTYSFADNDVNFLLAVFDIDHFKKVNDTYGHLFGNQVIQYLTEHLLDSIRKTDITARFGGDEFLIFFPYRTDYKVIIQRIFKNITTALEKYQITISMGVATTEQGIERTFDELFKAADVALYTSKDINGSLTYYEPGMKMCKVGE